MRVLILLAFLLGLVFGQNQHVDTTAVTLAEAINADAEHFIVLIDHIEDEIDVNGQLLGERRVHVAMQFDIVEGTNVQVNGVAVPRGYSQLTFQAAIFEIDVAGNPSPFDQIVKIEVRLFVGEKLVQMEDGSSVTGVYIQERVVGIQEKEVWQASVKEQVLIVRADGVITRSEAIEIDSVQGEPKEHNHHHNHHPHSNPNGPQPDQQQQDQPQDQNADDLVSIVGEPPKHEKCQLKKYLHQAWNWFSNLPFYLRLLLSFAIGLVLGIVGIVFLKMIRCICCGGQKRCCRNESKEANYKKNIHLYSLQYTSLPTDEKAADKKPVESV